MSVPDATHFYPFTTDINDSIGTAHLSPFNNLVVSHSTTDGATFSINNNYNRHLYCNLGDVGMNSGRSWSVSFWLKAGDDIRDKFILGSRGSGKHTNGGHVSSATLHIETKPTGGSYDVRYGMHGNDTKYNTLYNNPPGLSANNFLNTSNYHLIDYVHWVVIYDYNNVLGNGNHRKYFYVNGTALGHYTETNNTWLGPSNGTFTVGNGGWSTSQNTRTLDNQSWLSLAIYDIPLSSSQVSAIYNLGKYQSQSSGEQPSFPLDVSLGIVSWYNGDSYDTSINKWVDKSTTFDLSSVYIRGNVIKKYNPTTQTLITNRNNNKYYQNRFQPYLSGDKNSGIIFSNTETTKFLPDVSYTFFHVARRNPIENNTSGRIFDGSGVNWYSGFNDASSGVALHDTSYINIIDKNYGQNWVVSVDRPNYYRSVGYSDTSNGYYETIDGNINSTNTNSPFVTIHSGNTTLQNNSQQCEWNVAEVISYNRLLQLSEENKIFNYLKNKYLGTNDSTSGELYQLTGDISANNMVKGYPPEYPTTQNIIGWYTPESYHVDTSFIWSDISPYKNDLSGCGTPSLIASDTSYNNLSYIRGSKGESYDVASGFSFPDNFLPSDGSYTLIHVSRRINDCSGRIFDSSTNVNFYSGFVDFKTGVALHSIDVSKSITQTSGDSGSNIDTAVVIYKTTSSGNLNDGGYTQGFIPVDYSGSIYVGNASSDNAKESPGFVTKTNINISNSHTIINYPSYYSSITNGTKVLISGIYRLKTNIIATSSVVRPNICVGFEINGDKFHSSNIVNPITSSFYIRNLRNHTTSSGYTAGIYNLSRNDQIKLISTREAATGTVTLDSNNSYLEVVKINTPCAVRTHQRQINFDINSTPDELEIPMNGTLTEFNGSDNFTANGNGIQVTNAGIYKISFNMFILAQNGSDKRFSFNMYFKKNDSAIVPKTMASSFYIRNTFQHNMSSGYLSRYVSLNADDTLYIVSKSEGESDSGCFFWHLVNSTKYSSFMDIEKITDPLFTCTAKDSSTDQNLNIPRPQSPSTTKILFESPNIYNEFNGSGNFELFNGGIRVSSEGKYIVSTNIAASSAVDRTNIKIYFVKNADTDDQSIPSGKGASSYIRNHSTGGNNNSSIYLSRTLHLNANDNVSVHTEQEANNGTVTILPRESIFEIRKI